jgi:kumamolisin
VRISRLPAPIVACVVAALAAPVLATTPAGAASVRQQPTGPTQRVLLTLAPQDRGALRALARSSSVRRAETAASLSEALPSDARRRSVADTARNLGLHVDRSNRMSVLVSGRASLVRSLFGSARAVDPRSPVQHPLPSLPSALRGQVTVAFGGDDNRPAFRHFGLPDGTADGTDFRTAYGDTDTSPLAAPSAHEKAATIATVQLSGWHSSDLDAYATFLRNQTGNAGWPAPRYTGVDDPLLPSHVAQSGPNFGNDIEVDLDQEAIYAVAPFARQRAYLSGNDLFGMYDSLAAIGDDASDPTVDRHLIAASISWGFCETDLNSDPSSNALYAAFEDVLSYDLATGVTVFSASGDDGSKCDGSHLGVSYPASSPQVISVGGTQHTGGDVIADPPSGWKDTFGSSAGGASKVFPRPAYQPFALTGSTMRTVPDISALAGDPGFDVRSTSPAAPHAVDTYGGTSLASPVSAATYAVQVAQHNFSWGVGNILPGLYDQAANTPSSFTDVDDGCVANDSSCAGWNGVDVAHAGYDQVTGLGTPVWSSIVSPGLGGDPHLSVGRAYSNSRVVPVTVRTPDWQSYDRFRIDVDGDHVCTVNNASATKPTSVTVPAFGGAHSADGVHSLTLVAFNSADNICHYSDAFVFVDTTDPSPTAGLSITKGVKNLLASWGGNDRDFFSEGSGIRSLRVKLGYPGKVVLNRTTFNRGSVRVTAKPGKVYTLSVTATDYAGNVHTAVAQLVDDREFSFSRGWSRTIGPTAFDGSEATSTRRGAKASASATGLTYALYVTTCSTCGKIGIIVGGKQRRVIDTYSKRTHDRVRFTVYSVRSDVRRKLTFKVLGTQNSHSGGHRVIVDGLTTKG